MSTVRFVNAAGATARDDVVDGDFSHALKHADLNRPAGAVEQRIYDSDGRLVIRQTIDGSHYTADGLMTL